MHLFNLGHPKINGETLPNLELKDGRIFYETYGEKGRWVVLIHGAWASHEWWKEQIPVLSTRYRVLALDVRGHGRSSRLRRPSSVKKFSEDLHELLTHLNVEEAALIGWSMGGLISLQYTVDHPEVVRALVLIASRAHKKRRGYDPLKEYLEKLAETMAFSLSSPFEFFMALDNKEYYMREFRREVEDMFTEKASEELIDWAMRAIQVNSPEDLVNVSLSIKDFDLSAKLSEIKVPTLIIAGGRDRMVPLSLTEKLKEIPNSEMVVFPDAGHYLLLEEPEKVNACLMSFLQKAYPPSA